MWLLVIVSGHKVSTNFTCVLHGCLNYADIETSCGHTFCGHKLFAKLKKVQQIITMSSMGMGMTYYYSIIILTLHMQTPFMYINSLEPLFICTKYKDFLCFHWSTSL